MRKGALGAVVALFIGVMGLPAGATHGGDVLVSNGSVDPFAGNKQNEPGMAVDANHPNVMVAGSNDEIDLEDCNAGADNTCPFTDGVGVSGVYFSFDSGDNWTQPTYTGYSARNCVGAPGGSDDPPSADSCDPMENGPIGTLPKYDENGLVADGDPAMAFGPRPGPNGFSWANGSRLYYATLASNFPGRQEFKGFEAIAVSRTDNVVAAAANDEDAWKKPVIVSKQNSALFSDKEQIWADNVEISPHFGNAYVCFAAFRGGPGTSQPLIVATSRDGGSSWASRQVSPATNNTSSKNGFGRSGCTVRTDSDGVAYVFYYQFGSGLPGTGAQMLVRSFDGGDHWSRPQRLFTAVDTCNAFEPSIGRCVMDGVAGARSDLSPAPSVDIANGAPTGADATDEIVLTWVDGRDGLNREHVMYTQKPKNGPWARPQEVETPGDRGFYSAPAISPDGTDAWLVYNAFTTPYQPTTSTPRSLIAVMKHADVNADGSLGPWTTMHRSPPGDPRSSSQNNLAAEFLGDYVYAVATRSYAAAVWNDSRRGGVCEAVNQYRQDLHEYSEQTGIAVGRESKKDRAMGIEPTAPEDAPTAPAVQQECPPNFGNSDIYGGSYAEPAP